MTTFISCPNLSIAPPFGGSIIAGSSGLDVIYQLLRYARKMTCYNARELQPVEEEGGTLPAPQFTASLSCTEQGQQLELQLHGHLGRHPQTHQAGPCHGWDLPPLPFTSAISQLAMRIKQTCWKTLR